MNESVELTIRGRNYTVRYPNVGEYYRIEAMKQVLGRGYYNSLAQTPTQTAVSALDMIDIEATLSILCPQVIEDLKVSNFSDLGLKDYQEIKRAFFDSVVPFLSEINEFLKEIPEKSK